MKKNRIPLILTLFALCACQGTTNSDSTINTDTTEDKKTESTSRKQNVYEQLTYALEDLDQSFTLTGKLSHQTYDGSNNEQVEREVLAEMDSTAYYYSEADIITGEILTEENFFQGEDEYLYSRTLNPLNNEVVEAKTKNKYADVMDSPLQELKVECLSAVREKPNWYLISTKYRTLASEIVYYLTGYQTTGLPGYMPSHPYYGDVDYTPTVSEFALHYNGDEIDQFRFILELEISEDDGTYYYEGMLFELDISDLGITEPREITPLEHTTGHDTLSEALKPYRYDNTGLKNYTMHIDVSYDSKQLTGYSYEYYVDFENQIIFNTYDFTGYIAPEKEDEEYGEYKYNLAYQFENDNIYIYRYLADDTHEFVRKDEFKKYWGISDTSEIGTTFLDCAPKIGSLAVECFMDNKDNTFTPYTVYKSLAMLSMNTFEEYVNEPTSGDYTIILNKDGTLNSITNSLTGSYALNDSTTTISATRTYTTTITDYNTTTVPSYCVPHE